MKLPWLEAARLERNGTPFVVVTMIGSRGHAPQDPGAKALVTASGLHAGTVGGGKVEARCIEEAKKMLAEPGRSDPKVFNWNLQRDIGMTCGGEVTYLFEKTTPSSWRIVVFGAGHVAQKLARILRTIDCRATFVDSRPEWVQRFPKSSNVDYICIAEPKDYLTTLAREPNVIPYFAIMTRGHATDMPVLREVLNKFPNSPYFGVIGSKVKGLKIRNELKTEGYPQELLERLHSPMGLPIGNNDPAEISISIVAQLLQVRDKLSQRIDDQS